MSNDLQAPSLEPAEARDAAGAQAHSRADQRRTLTGAPSPAAGSPGRDGVFATDAGPHAGMGRGQAPEQPPTPPPEQPPTPPPEQPPTPPSHALAVPDEQERRARAAWSRLIEPGDVVAASLVAELGAVEALEQLRRYRGSRRAVLRYLPRLKSLDLDRDLRAADRIGARLVVPGDGEWPTGLEDLECPPMCLWVRGTLSLQDCCRRSVAIVGARAATSYGVMVAADLAAGVQGHGFTVISGAAFGIDAAAHRGALGVDGATIAVLAGGVDRPYPAAHADLIDQVVRVGAVVSEVPTSSPPTKLRFLQRNRLIAAMSQGTVVVEAGIRSGALSTLNHAVGIGRIGAAVPGPVTSMMSAGTHQAIRDGRACLVTDVEEVVDLVGSLGSDAMARKRAAPGEQDDLEEDALRVMAVLPRSGEMESGKIAVAAGLSVGDVVSQLGRLQLASLARRGERGWSRTS